MPRCRAKSIEGAIVKGVNRFGGIRGETKRRYIGAVHAAMDRDYRPMTATFRGVIARSLRTQVTASSARGRS